MPADPGGQQVGQISIRVVPNTADFAQELKEKLRQLEKQLKVQLPVEVDPHGVIPEVKRVAEKASGETIELDTSVDSDGVVRHTRRARQIAQKATRAIQLMAELNLTKSMAKIWAQVKIIQRSVKGYNIRLPIEWVGLAKLLGVAGLVSSAFLGVQNVIVALGGALKATAGIALTLPAVMAAAGVGIATLVVGLRGFFGALKNSGDAAAFEESLRKLAPSAQESARALARFREPLKEIQQATQQSMFENMAGSFSKLGVLLPPLRTGMVNVAAGIREMARSWIEMATSQQSVTDLGSIMDGTSKAFANARPAAASFAQALRDIAAVGAGFLPRMGTAVANIANRFRDFIASARESGKLAGWIENGISSFRQFGQVLSNVWGIFSNVANAMRGGQGLLDMLTQITGKLKEMTGSVEGQAALQGLAKVMRQVASSAGDVFVELFRQLSDVLQELTPFLVEFAKQLGSALVGALKIAGPLLKSFAKFLSDNKAIMVPLLVALTGVVTAFKLLSTVATGINALKTSLEAMKAAKTVFVDLSTGLFDFTTNLISSTKRVLVASGQWVAAITRKAAVTIASWTRMAVSATANALSIAATWTANAFQVTVAWIAQMTRMVVVTIANWVRMAVAATVQGAIIAATWTANAFLTATAWVVQMARMAALTLANWVRMAIAASVNATVIAATWIAQGAVMAASWLANMARIVAFTVANWIRMAAVALAQAARMAASWFIAMGPVGWVIGIIVALVALIIANWDRIVAFTKAAWTWVSNAVRDGATGAKNAAVNTFNSVVSFMASIPGRVRAALGNLGSLLLGAGKALIQGFIDGIKGAFNGAISAVKSGIATVRSYFPFSPAKRGPFAGKGYTLFSGRALMEDWAKGIEQKAPAAIRTMENAMQNANAAVTADWQGHMTAENFGLGNSVRDGVLAAFSGSKLQVDGSGVAKLVNNVNNKNARR